jgi:type II secretory pathway predicted ATPase ExeA
VTGEIGAGKTTLVRHLLNQTQHSDITIGLVTNTHRSFGDLFQWILNAYGIDYNDKSRVEQHQAFTDFLIDEYGNNRRVVLIIDEAQNMDLEALEELRLLSNINADHDQILQIILVGQPELRKKLQDPSLEQFAQRILADYHLESLSKDEVVDYIRHRLAVAGGNREIFDSHACNYIAYFSRGVPRLVNMLCDLALVYGFTQDKSVVDAKVVEEVVRDKLKGGITPLRKPLSKIKNGAAVQA